MSDPFPVPFPREPNLLGIGSNTLSSARVSTRVNAAPYLYSRMSAAWSTGYVSRPTVPSCFCLAAFAYGGEKRGGKESAVNPITWLRQEIFNAGKGRSEAACNNVMSQFL